MLLEHSFKMTEHPVGDNNKPTSLTEWTYRYLKEKILNLEIAPGEQIHINEFAEKLEISRTPIREAFLRLMADGLIEVRPRVGYFVTEITEQDICELFEIRELVEARAAKKATGMLSDEDLTEMQNILDESNQAVKKGNLDVFIKNDVKFHGYLERCIQNNHMRAFIDSIMDLTHRERIMSTQMPENVEQTLIEHQRILDGLKKRDANLAEWFMGEHLSKVCERLTRFLSEKNKKEMKEK